MASMPLAMALTAMKPELAEQVEVEQVLEPSRRAYRAALPSGELSAQIATWVETYLESSILTKVDRASMLHSLEVRAPFLDPQVADLLSILPPELIFHGGRGKRLLRRVAVTLLPAALMRKPKKGLGVPQAEWLRTVLRARVEAALEHARTDGWFDHGTIETLWREHLAGTADYRRSLWSFVFAAPFQ
jgi:asparagine synthase (glutamine-hydrolysing)